MKIQLQKKAAEKSNYKCCKKEKIHTFAVHLLECLPDGRQGGIGRPVCRQAGALDKMFTVYAISSVDHNYIYVGMTQNLEERLKRHNTGREKTTRPYLPFKLIFTEVCESRLEGRKREKYWKSGIGKEKLRELRKLT